MNSKINEPKSVGPGVTVRLFVAGSKLMKAGRPVVPYKITAIDSMHDAFKELTTVYV